MRPLLLILLATLLPGCRPEVTTPPAPRPNILLFIADDWSYPHAGVYGDPVIRTPAFDRLAAGGMLFTNAYTASPSCSPARAAILSGRYPHQNGVAGNLWSRFPLDLAVYPEILAEAGYYVGHDQKGWGPGDFRGPGRAFNPAGKRYSGFREFLDEKDATAPFCYWMGSTDPHREYLRNLGAHTGLRPDSVRVPGFFPDLPCVRNDILDYYAEVERFDRHVGEILDLLEARGELDNTLVVVTSDNGMPFPRAKANLYDYGSRMPFVAFWPERIPAGSVRTSYVNTASLAPTFLEAAGVEIPDDMTLPSLLPQLTDPAAAGADRVFLERERHAQVRADSGSYAMRGIRTDDFLYVRNFYPERWPAGDPRTARSVGPYGDVDHSITKVLALENVRPAGDTTDYFRLSFGKRPAEELYDLREDPEQLRNVAGSPRYATDLRAAQNALTEWMQATADPRATEPRTDLWDTTYYVSYPARRQTYPELLDEFSDYEYASPHQPTRFTYLPCAGPIRRSRDF